MDGQQVITLKEILEMFSFDQFWSDITNQRLYKEVLCDYWQFSMVAFFWLGCNIGSFLNVCIYRLPIGMSLCHPKSHCPKCGHKISWYENIPLFSYIFLLASCKECGKRISPRYIIVEFITGVLFAAIYLKVLSCKMPFSMMFLFFYLTAVLLSAAFTDCDLRVIPDKLTIPAMFIIPVFFLLNKSIYPFQPNWNAFLLCLANMAGTAAVMSAFVIGGKKIFKRDVLGWGDVKYLVVTAGALGWFITLLILLFASVLAMIYMPIYWIFRPKRRKRGFAFAPFMTICALGMIIFGQYLYPFIKKFINFV